MAFDFKTFGNTPDTQPEKATLGKFQPIQQENKMPILTKETGGLGIALRDVGVGLGKELIESSRGTARLLQDIGKGTLGIWGADTSQMGIKSLEDTQIDEQLKAKSRGEQVGKVLGFGTELATGYTKAKPVLEARKGVRAIRAVTPEVKALGDKAYKEAVAKGRITPTKFLSPEKYILPESEKMTALKYRKLLTSKDPIKNSNNLFREIAKQDESVGKFLGKNNSIFNTGELKNFVLKQLESVDDVMVTPERLMASKERIVDGFIRALPKNDMKTLWKSRKAFDNAINNVFSGSPTLQKTIKREFRNAIQDFIGTKTPNKVYSDAMKEMRNIYRLTDNLALQAAREKGMSGIRILMRRHPTAVKILGGIGGYQVAKALGIIGSE